MSLKVVHISGTDRGHGAGIAAYRLNLALQQRGIRSHLLVAEKLSQEKTVMNLTDQVSGKMGKTRIFLCNAMERVLNLIGPQDMYSFAGGMLQKNNLVKEADVIHFHNIHSHIRNFSVLNLMIALQKPVIWTFHDMWPLTGHTCYPLDCERWKTGCGKCPYIEKYVRIIYDTSAFQWKIKKSIYNKVDFTIITPSSWLYKNALKSELVAGKKIVKLSGGINPDIFKRNDVNMARTELGIDHANKVILFLATDIKNVRKGYEYFERAMLELPADDTIMILAVGKGGVSDALKEKYKVKEVGRVNFDEEMARVYSSADILVMPSLQDNLPNVMLESLACGTPVVAFNNSGVPDVVKHMVNGYLANNKDYKDLSNGIKLLLNNVELLKQMGASAVRFMLDEYCDKTMAEKHLELYREAIAQFQYKNGEKGHRQYDINEKI